MKILHYTVRHFFVIVHKVVVGVGRKSSTFYSDRKWPLNRSQTLYSHSDFFVFWLTQKSECKVKVTQLTGGASDEPLFSILGLIYKTKINGKGSLKYIYKIMFNIP